MSFLHNQIFEIGDHEATHHNLPTNYDIIFIPMPDALLFDETGFVLTYKGMVVDYGTGTYADFLLSPKPVAMYKLGIEVFSRAIYNRILDFIFTIEGRYLSFWTTTMIPQFHVCGYGPEAFPSMESLDTIGGEGRNYFYALNWGQVGEWNGSKKLILLYANGYRDCYWIKPTAVEVTDDFRVLRVSYADELPEIPITAIDLITDGIYVRSNKDEIKFEALTSTIFDITMELLEDVPNYYDPWNEQPKIYPVDEG